MTTYFADNFVGSGAVAGTTPPTNFGSYVWANTSGTLSKSSIGIGSGSGEIYCGSTTNGATTMPQSIVITFNVAYTYIGSGFFDLFYVKVGNPSLGTTFQAYVRWGASTYQLHLIGAGGADTQLNISSPTNGTYTGTLTITPGSQTFNMFGNTVSRTDAGFTGSTYPDWVSINMVDSITAMSTISIAGTAPVVANPWWTDYNNTFEIP